MTQLEIPEFVDLTIDKVLDFQNELTLVSQRDCGLVDVYVSDISAMPYMFLVDTHEFDLPIGTTRPLSLVVPGRTPDVRFEIGEAIISEGSTQLKLFGEAHGSTVHFLF